MKIFIYRITDPWTEPHRSPLRRFVEFIVPFSVGVGIWAILDLWLGLIG